MLSAEEPQHLAVECGYEHLAEVQEEILWMCEAGHVPVIWATEVLENLAKTGAPSRAEITDAALGRHRRTNALCRRGRRDDADSSRCASSCLPHLLRTHSDGPPDRSSTSACVDDLCEHLQPALHLREYEELVLHAELRGAPVSLPRVRVDQALLH